MNNVSSDIHVCFLRHGRTSFDYENSAYEEFIEMLCNGHATPLVEEHGIDRRSLPDRVDFVGYSPARRAVDTAQVLNDNLAVRSMEEMAQLSEVRFDKDIILSDEYTSLAGVRNDILKRWYWGDNKAETFKNSLARVREIETFLLEQQGETIILVTHGWFLRLLEIYFVHGKREDIELQDLLGVDPVPLGHSIKATLRRNSIVEARVDLLGMAA